MEIIKHQLILLHCLVNIENHSSYCWTSNKKLLDGIKGLLQNVFINFLEELTKTWINTLFSIYSVTKLLLQIFNFVFHKLVLSFRHKFMMWSRKWIYPNLTNVKIDDPKIETLFLSRYISKSFDPIWLIDVSKSKFVNIYSEFKYIKVIQHKSLVWCVDKRDYFFWVIQWYIRTSHKKVDLDLVCCLK